ncbi:hypothetical protein LTR94_024477 [Friedmanniomyces endolithicus]|nr:hypothetical protein LTR94_024477 [Friedmanniomyces endolithicus]
MTLPLRIGTRRSKLALAQSGMMQRAIGRALGVAEDQISEAVPLVEIVTTGDRIQDRRLLEIGGKALFTKEIEEALLDGRIDVAVHSMKDVPAEQPKGLAIAAIPEREDARDAFISRDFASFDDLPFGARIGTASLRRQAQALALRPDLKIEMLRGNIDTRLRRAADGEFDAIFLAVSGMSRLGVAEHIRQALPLDAFLPAPGQGALALQTRTDDVSSPWTERLNHQETAIAVAAERGAMAALEGSCRTAIGAYAHIENDQLRLTTEMLSPDGSARWRRIGEIAQPTLDLARGLGMRLGAEVHDAAGDQKPGSERTAEGLRALGFEPVVKPVLILERLEPAVPDLALFSGLVMTSPNGVCAFSALTTERAVPVFAVGEATAVTARQAGFEAVISADGDVAALAGLIAAKASDTALLAVLAQDPAGDLQAAVNGAGGRNVRIERLSVYRTSAARLGAPPPCDALLLHSPKAARAIAALGSGSLEGVLVCAISRAAAAPIEDLGITVHVAEAPNEASLLKRLKAALGKRDPRV